MPNQGKSVSKMPGQGKSVSTIFSDHEQKIAKKMFIDIDPETFRLYIDELKMEILDVVERTSFYTNLNKVETWVAEYTDYVSDYYDHYKDELYSLHYEGKVYAEVLSKKYEDHPNFLKFVSFEKTKFPANYVQDYVVRSIVEKTDYLVNIIPTCSVAFRLSSGSYLDIPYSVFQKIIPKYFIICSINMQLITAPLGKKIFTLFDLIKDHDRQVDQMETRKALFQVIYTLKMMEKDGLQHNDMHDGNVLIEVLDEERVLSYVMEGGEIVSISTKYVAHVFDWNYAYTPMIGPNKLLELDFYNDLGIRNECIHSFDLYTLLSSLNDHMRSDEKSSSRGILSHLLNRSIYYGKIWWNEKKNCFDGFDIGDFFISEKGYMHRCNRTYCLHYFENVSDVLRKMRHLISQQ